MGRRSRSRSPEASREEERRRRHKDRSRSRSRDRKQTRHRSRSAERDKKNKKRKREKSAERRARKEEKRRLEEEEALQVAELSVYSATDNPFHDANLSQQFKWHKRIERDKKLGISAAEAQRRDAIRRQEAKEELERLNKRRSEREVEQQLREEEELRMQRLNESAQMADWLAKDDDFQLEQERRRAAIRLKEKRAKAIDFLALNLRYVNPVDEEDGFELDEAGLEIDLEEPYAILESLTLEQTEELHDNIERYLQLEETEVNIEFWTNMMVVCKDWLERLRLRRSKNDSTAIVESDVNTLLNGKSYEQLSQLQRQIQNKLASGEPVDVEYWEGLLKSLLVWKAKAKLRSLHEVVVRNRLEQLRKRQRDEAFHAQKELLAGVSDAVPTKTWGGDMRIESVPEAGVVSEEGEPVEEYSRDMSPDLMDVNRLSYEDRQIAIINEADNWKELIELRRSVAASRFVAKAETPAPARPQEPGPSVVTDIDAEAMYRAEAERELDEEEELFNLEETIANPTTYVWEDKYRPRKPRYFNRVHTGYEWNKYNQTHYDTDNPPPKVVQGYKFNIFYPDLIDKSKAPTYKIIKEPGNEDTVLLYFTAGPPYEDIAFRIVNRDWEYSHKRGFRSSFDRGCLSLWFNFRRNFYRK